MTACVRKVSVVVMNVSDCGRKVSASLRKASYYTRKVYMVSDCVKKVSVGVTRVSDCFKIVSGRCQKACLLGQERVKVWLNTLTTYFIRTVFA